MAKIHQKFKFSSSLATIQILFFLVGKRSIFNQIEKNFEDSESEGQLTQLRGVTCHFWEMTQKNVPYLPPLKILLKVGQDNTQTGGKWNLQYFFWFRSYWWIYGLKIQIQKKNLNKLNFPINVFLNFGKTFPNCWSIQCKHVGEFGSFGIIFIQNLWMDLWLKNQFFSHKSIIYSSARSHRKGFKRRILAFLPNIQWNSEVNMSRILQIRLRQCLSDLWISRHDVLLPGLNSKISPYLNQSEACVGSWDLFSLTWHFSEKYTPSIVKDARK